MRKNLLGVMKRGRQEGHWTFLYIYSLRVFRECLPAVKCGRKSDHLGSLCRLFTRQNVKWRALRTTGYKKTAILWEKLKRHTASVADP